MAKQIADVDARLEVTVPSQGVTFFFVKSIIGTIQRQFHEARKVDCILRYGFSSDFLDKRVQKFQLFRVWCGFS